MILSLTVINMSGIRNVRSLEDDIQTLRDEQISLEKKKEEIATIHGLTLQELQKKIEGDIFSTLNNVPLDNKNKEILTNEEEKKQLTHFPFPTYPHYTEFWNNLSLEDQEKMKQNFKETNDGKLECIKMGKKLSVLTATFYGKDVIDGSHQDKHGISGKKGVAYFTGKAAKREAKNQGKELFKTQAEVEEIIDLFPGKSLKQRAANFVQFFGLAESGHWNSLIKIRYDVGSVAYATLSEADGFGRVCGVSGDAKHNIHWYSQSYPTPVIVRDSEPKVKEFVPSSQDLMEADLKAR